MDDCEAGFSLTERSKFLDGKLIQALERIEQQDCLRSAGLENLVGCPFCQFAAEYPPIEVDREFRCLNPDCETISCRLCKAETHIPKTCEEHAKTNGISLRRQIEEAMSAAMIRKCNKCESSNLTCYRVLTRHRQHPFYQGKWMQQDGLHPLCMSKHAVLRVFQVVRLLSL